MSVPYTRIDTAALFDALDEARRARGLVWKQVAEEVGWPAITEGMLRQTAKGGRIGAIQFMAYASWLGVPAERFLLRPAESPLPGLMDQLSNLLCAQNEIPAERALETENAIRALHAQIAG